MKPDALRKAAILISVLDQRSGDALLDQMSPAQAACVRRAVMELDEVDEAEQREVIREFVRPNSVRRSACDEAADGVELALSLTPPPCATYPPPDVPAGQLLSGSSAQLRHFQQADPGQLAALLCHEHPQTVAVVTSQLSPQRASELLRRMPEELQSEVLRRIAMLSETDPEIVQEIQQTLEMRLSGQSTAQPIAGSGIATVRAILRAAQQKDRQRILARLAGDDPGLAERLQAGGSGPPVQSPAALDCEPAGRAPMDGAGASPSRRLGGSLAHPSTGQSLTQSSPGADQRPLPVTGGRAHDPDDSLRTTPTRKGTEQSDPPQFTFVDLAALDDAGLAAVFRCVDPHVALIALAGAQDDLVARIARQLSPRQARHLQRQMCQVGPIRLRDVERAQQQLAQVAEDLGRQGLVTRSARARCRTDAA